MPTHISTETESTANRWSLAVFGIAVLVTAVLVVMGVTGMHWPKWLLALAAVF